ncbi:hypothetical protein FQN50_002179 [Emmonsiellopsis sp. PD_5]|nr:hypothetical protein FQN50_002179 [Emmonsiellopsis sp. PD_5]
MDMKRKFVSEDPEEGLRDEKKKSKKRRLPKPDAGAPRSPASREPSASKNKTKVQSRLAKVEKLTRKLLSDPDLIRDEAGPDVVAKMTELGKAFAQKQPPKPDEACRSQSPRDRLYSTSLQLHTQDSLPVLPLINDTTLATAVFTHEGIINPQTRSLTEANYERMELLGDAYIEIMATRLVWDSFPRLPSGRLSQIRELLVKNETLAEFSTRYGLDQRLSVPQDLRNQSKTWTKIKGDVFEAYVAAVILSNREKGVDLVEDWLTQLWIPKLEQIEKEQPVLRYKEELAKQVMGKGIKLAYRDDRKPINHPGGLQTFFISVYLTGWGYTNECLGSGTGLNKVIAGNEAAKKALENSITKQAAAVKRAFDEKVRAEREKAAS